MGTELSNLQESLKMGNVSAGNYIEIEEDGTPVQKGEAKVWEDTIYELMGAGLDTTSGRTGRNYFNGTVFFADNARYPNENAGVMHELEHANNYGTGAIIKPHLHWIQQQAAFPNFLLAYKILKNGDPVTIETDYTNHTLDTLQSHAFTYSSGNLDQISSFSPISIAGLNVSDKIHMVLFRDSANASAQFAGVDPVVGIVHTFILGVHAQKDMNGSRQEFIK